MDHAHRAAKEFCRARPQRRQGEGWRNGGLAQGRVGAGAGWLAQRRVMKSQVSERPRRATNLTVRRELVVAARQVRINLSALLERALEEELVRLKWRRWRRENAASIAAYNRHIKEHRPFSQILLRW